MQKNVAGQKWIVFAFDRTDNTPKTGDAANITANLRIDGAAANAVDDVNPTELEDGYYVFDITQAESNGENIVIAPASSTGDIQVIGVPGAVWTRPANFPDLAVVATTGRVDVDSISGTQQTANDNGADINTLIIQVGTAGDGLTAINLPNQTMDITGSLSGSVGSVTGAVGSVTGHTNQTGDSFALANGATGFVAIDTVVDAIKAVTDNLPDSGALSSLAQAAVVGALADVAAAGEVTSADTLMQYIKQLINILIGTAGIGTFPAEAAPGNGVSLAEVVRAIHADVTGLNGSAMIGTNSAALASVCTEGRLAELDAGNLPADLDLVLADTNELQGDWTNTGRLDTILDAILVDSNALNDTKVPDTISLAAINAEVDTALNTAIPATPTADSINQYIQALKYDLINKMVITEATADTITYKDNDSTEFANVLNAFNSAAGVTTRKRLE